MDTLISDRAIAEREQRLSLREFLAGAWPILEPGTTFVPGWHIDAICEHLEAIATGQIRRLIINVPPGTSKSMLCSVLFPTWLWTQDPMQRFLTASYAQPLATRDALRSRRLIQSSWYQDRWGHLFQLTSDQNTKTRYDNDKMGSRIATSVGGTVTGERANGRIMDDPHKPEEALSDQVREGDIEWSKTTWSTRAADPRHSWELVVMQRLHEHDMAGHLLEEVGGYVHLMLPMRFESERKCVTSIGFEDPRKDEGELLCPERFDEESVHSLEWQLTIHAAGQLQQRPTAEQGEIFKAENWRFWYPDQPPSPWQVRLGDGGFHACAQEPLPSEFERMAQSWDMAFKDTRTSAFVVGQVWGKAKADVYLVDQARDHMDFPATCEAVREVTKRHPKASAKWVEEAANGAAVIASLRREIAGLIPVSPEGSKEARAHAVTPFQASGNVYLPHPALYPWVQELLAELTQFPNSRYKDQVDALTQALHQLLGRSMAVSDQLTRINKTAARHKGLAAGVVSQQW